MAESSPSQNGSLYAGSDVTFDIVCFACNSDGHFQEAESYCLDCGEHLCTSCLQYHRRFSATKHHKIIDKENMPREQSILSANDICIDNCQTHNNEIIKFFCSSHKTLGCHVCVSVNHKLCNDVIYIPEEAKDLSDTQEFKEFQNKLQKLIKKSENIIMVAKSNTKLSADNRTKAVQEIESYRQELNDTLDQLKEEIEHQSEEIEFKHSEKMGIMADTSNQVLAELQRIASDIKESFDKNQYCKLFIDMKNAEDNLTDMQTRLPNEVDIFVTVVSFQPNSELQKVLQRNDAFGKLLVQSPTEMNATFLTDINEESAEDTVSRHVGSAALLTENNNLAKTVTHDKSVQLIDTKQKTV